eukprot:4420297-Amphidinium_carterae.1
MRRTQVPVRKSERTHACAIFALSTSERTSGRMDERTDKQVHECLNQAKKQAPWWQRWLYGWCLCSCAKHEHKYVMNLHVHCFLVYQWPRWDSGVSHVDLDIDLVEGAC